MLLSEQWGFLLALMASVPFWYSAIPIFIWGRDLGFRRPTWFYRVVVWGMFPAFGILKGRVVLRPAPPVSRGWAAGVCRASSDACGRGERTREEAGEATGMEMLWGVVLILLGVVAWGGQAMTVVSRETAERLGLTERASTVDPAFYADVRGEAAWDALTLWTLPLAGVLLVIGDPSWAYLGLVGGAMYAYFGGRGVVQRLSMQRLGVRIGAPEAVRTALVALAVWAAAGLVTIVLAAGELTTN